MCGILGYVGEKEAAPVLVEGLRKLEYRGYDSAGVAVYSNGKISVARAKGKLVALEKRLASEPVHGKCGIGHTRWATHGKPSDENAHPHRSSQVVVVHNGIIENHLELRKKMIEAGFQFHSETDTEVVPFLIEFYLKKGETFEKAVRSCIRELKGAFAFAIFCSSEPDKVIAVKNSSPLILGIGKGENFIASDIPALLGHTQEIVVLEDGEMAVITKNKYWLTDFEGKPIDRKPKTITWTRGVAEKEGFKHFMLKEIHEQPIVIADTLRGRVDEVDQTIVLDETGLTDSEVSQIKRIQLIACGTSWHAALVGKFWIEMFAKISTEVDLASEYRYRNPIVDKSVLLIPISQSGETADTLAALEEARKLGANSLAICNVVESSIARKSAHVLYTHAGPEIGVASTKAFTSQLVSLAMLALYLAQKKNSISKEELKKHLHALIMLPNQIEKYLKTESQVLSIAKRFVNARDFLYLGRGSSYPIALEGALKLKEISYIHAEGYAGGEIKHGPIALVDEKMPIVALVSGGSTYPKMVSNIQEVAARGGKVISVVSKGDDSLKKMSEVVIELPPVDDFTRPILETIPLQLLAYYLADELGKDVDQPRNLAKSVTVE